jgi:hypothetical protein
MGVFKRGTGILPVKYVQIPMRCRKESRAGCPCHAISQLPDKWGRRFRTLALAFELATVGFGIGLGAAVGGAVKPATPPPPIAPLQPTSASVSSVIKTPPPGMGSAGQMVSPNPKPTPAPIRTPTVTRPPAVSAKTVPATASLPVKTPPTTPAVVGVLPVAAPAPSPPPPPPVRPFAYSYVPPLSVEEASSLIRASVDILTITDTGTLVARCQKVREIIEVTSNYLNQLDQRYSTLSSYDWHFIDREKVDGPGIDRDEFRAQPLISKASAISFAADFGDVYIYSVAVLDASGNATTFTINRLIEENYPHQVVCYLFFPKTIQSVAATYQARGDSSRTPRLAIFAGVAREEEYLKQALWFLRYVRREMDVAIQNPEAAAPHVGNAGQNLRNAASRLIRFRVKRIF